MDSVLTDSLSQDSASLGPGLLGLELLVTVSLGLVLQ